MRGGCLLLAHLAEGGLFSRFSTIRVALLLTKPLLLPACVPRLRGRCALYPSIPALRIQGEGGRLVRSPNHKRFGERGGRLTVGVNERGEVVPALRLESGRCVVERAARRGVLERVERLFGLAEPRRSVVLSMNIEVGRLKRQLCILEPWGRAGRAGAFDSARHARRDGGRTAKGI
eukprot:scaffold4498_cov119-Isochrysis_galbana.AAC.40